MFTDKEAREYIAKLEAEVAVLKATEQEAYDLTMRTTTELAELRDENERLKNELAVRNRALEIWKKYGDDCPQNGICEEYNDLGGRVCSTCLHDRALAQARAELEAKPKPKFMPGDEVTHIELDNPFIVTTCYWDNGMWWYPTGRALVMAVGEPKLRLVEQAEAKP